MRSATKRRDGKDAEYCAFIASLPCIICRMTGEQQRSRTEVAHIGRNRGMSRKCPDRETAPLCGIAHHREGPLSHHKLGTRFWHTWSADPREIRAVLNRMYDERTKS